MTKRGPFIKLLLTLTTFDTLFLINGGVFMLQQAFGFQNEVYNALFPKVIFPLAGISMTGTYVQGVRLKGLQRGLRVLITFNSLGIGRKSTREMKCLLFFSFGYSIFITFVATSRYHTGLAFTYFH